MATSGSTDFSADRDDIITEALIQIGALEIGGTPDATDLAECARTLNMMLKNWQADGVNLHARQKTYLFLDKDTNEYLLGSTAIYSTGINQTTLSAAASATDTSITVTSTANMADNSTHILSLDDGSNEFLTQNGAVAGSVMTFDAPAGGLSGAAASGNTLYHFSGAQAANRPMKILEAVRRDKNGIDIPMNIMSLQEYTDLSDKTADGVPVNLYYNPERTITRLRVWPEPSNASDYLVLWVQRTLEDLDAGTDEVDYPQEWFYPIALGLAMELADKYGVSDNIYKRVQERFMKAYDSAYYYDVEASTWFEPDLRNH